MSNRRGGIIQLLVNGQRYDAKGNFTYNFGAPMREAIIGADGVHGYKETPQVPFIEGEITDSVALDVKALLELGDATVTMPLANGKTFVLRNAWFASEGTANTEEGNIAFRFEGKSGEEVS